MAPRWGRIAADFHSNPKAVVAGIHGRAVFVFAICLNAGDAADGRIRRGYFGPNYLAHQLGISPDDAAAGLDAAVNAGLLRIDDQHVVLAGWNAEWAPPKSGGQRQAESRTRKRTNKCDASVTTGDGAVTASNDIREDKRRENKRRDRDPRAKVDRNRPLPADWAPSSKHHDLARQVGANADTEAAHFRDDATAKGKQFIDWDAAFRTWLRNVPKFTRNGSAKPFITATSVDDDDTPTLFENGRRT